MSSTAKDLSCYMIRKTRLNGCRFKNRKYILYDHQHPYPSIWDTVVRLSTTLTDLTRACIVFLFANLVLKSSLLDNKLYHLTYQVGAKVIATQMSQRIVTTQYGRLRGILVTFPERRLPDVEAYLGLEYASLLGGELRFMPPTSPIVHWDGVRAAHKFKPVCPQKLANLDNLELTMPRRRVNHLRRLRPFLERQQEECLSLNVYVPVRGLNYVLYNIFVRCSLPSYIPFHIV